jgi:septum formation protein
LKPLSIILASTSPYRKELLARLQFPFLTAAPDVDESPLTNESAQQTSIRLSIAKAHAVGASHPNSLIIGSDQVALLGDTQLGKPHTHDNAVRQLQSMRGRTIIFYTALTLLNTINGEIQTAVAENHVTFRDLTDEEIERYLLKEQPYNCAGSAKSEGLGIALISSMEGADPNALIGLPLILLIGMLKKQGVNVP